MTAAAHKLAELLILARRIGYEPDCFAATRAPAGLSVGDLEDFARLHAEVVALLAAGAELEGVKRELAVALRERDEARAMVRDLIRDLPGEDPAPPAIANPPGNRQLP